MKATTGRGSPALRANLNLTNPKSRNHAQIPTRNHKQTKTAASAVSSDASQNNTLASQSQTSLHHATSPSFNKRLVSKPQSSLDDGKSSGNGRSPTNQLTTKSNPTKPRTYLHLKAYGHQSSAKKLINSRNIAQNYKTAGTGAGANLDDSLSHAVGTKRAEGNKTLSQRSFNSQAQKPEVQQHKLNQHLLEKVKKINNLSGARSSNIPATPRGVPQVSTSQISSTPNLSQPSKATPRTKQVSKMHLSNIMVPRFKSKLKTPSHAAGKIPPKPERPTTFSPEKSHIEIQKQQNYLTNEVVLKSKNNKSEHKPLIKTSGSRATPNMHTQVELEEPEFASKPLTMRSTQVKLKNPLDVAKNKTRSPLTNKIAHGMINLMPKNEAISASAKKAQSPKQDCKHLSPYPPQPKLLTPSLGLNDAGSSSRLLFPPDAVPTSAQQASDSVAAKPGAVEQLNTLALETIQPDLEIETTLAPNPSHQRPISRQLKESKQIIISRQSSQSNCSNRSTRLTNGLRAGSGDLNHLIHKAVAEVERISPAPSARVPEQPQLPMQLKQSRNKIHEKAMGTSNTAASTHGTGSTTGGSKPLMAKKQSVDGRSKINSPSAAAGERATSLKATYQKPKHLTGSRASPTSSSRHAATVKPPQPQLKPNPPKTGKLVSNYVPQASPVEGLNPHNKNNIEYYQGTQNFAHQVSIRAENRSQTQEQSFKLSHDRYGPRQQEERLSRSASKQKYEVFTDDDEPQISARYQTLPTEGNTPQNQTNETKTQETLKFEDQMVTPPSIHSNPSPAGKKPDLSKPTSEVHRDRSAIAATKIYNLEIDLNAVHESTELCSKALELIKNIERQSQIDMSSTKNKNNESLDSDDSLIQTQKRMHQEYQEICTRSKIGQGVLENEEMQDGAEHVEYAEPKDLDNPFSLANDSPVNIQLQTNGRKRDRADCTTPPRKSTTRSPTCNSRSTNKKVTTNHHDGAEDIIDSAKDKKKHTESLIEKPTAKFPLKQFLSASSTAEEDMLIERYSMQLHSQTNISQANQSPQQRKPLQGRKLIYGESSYPSNKKQKGSAIKTVNADLVNDAYFQNRSTNQQPTRKHLIDLTNSELNQLEENQEGFQAVTKAEMPPKPYKVKKEENQAIAQSLQAEQPQPNIKTTADHKASVRDSCSLRESRTSLLKQSIIVTGDSPFMPFKESNRSPDSFVRVSTDHGKGGEYQYARASILQSELSRKSSIIDQNYLKAVDSFHINNTKAAAQTNTRNTTPDVKAKKPASPAKPTNKKNVEINLEKIIQIYNVLDSANHCKQNFEWPTSRFSEMQQKEEFEQLNADRIQEIIRCCEEWWNIIREPTVNDQLMKCIKILSNKKIQVHLQKALIYQLIFFSFAGFLISCQQYQFLENLKEIAYKSRLNFLVLEQILVDKFPPKTIQRNIWAQKLIAILTKEQSFREHLQNIEDQVMLSQSMSNPQSILNQSNVTESVNQSSMSMLSQKNLHGREAKYQYLRMNNNSIQDNLQLMVSRASQQRHADEVLAHPLFESVGEILDNISNKQTDLIWCIEKVGKSLRDDYDEPSVDHSLADQNKISNDTAPSARKTTDYGEFEHKQDQLSKQLRVHIDQGLQIVPAPYLRPKDNQSPYTLVLDLDETLLHFEEINDNEGQLSIRPGADSFLKLLSQYFEIVIFTAGTEEYADWALSFMDNYSCITHRLYRQHALPFNGYYVKDLSRVGRDLSKTIIVDNIAENFQLQPNNGIFIKTWISDPKDTCLFDLAPLLIKMVKSGIADVRDQIKQLNEAKDQTLYQIGYGSNENDSQQTTAKKQSQMSVGDGNIEFESPEVRNSRSSNQRGQQQCGAIDEISSHNETSEKSENISDTGKLGVQKGIELGLGCQAPEDFLKFQAQQQQSREQTPKTPNQLYQEDEPESYMDMLQRSDENTYTDYIQRQNGAISTIIETQNEVGSSVDGISLMKSRKIVPRQQSAQTTQNRDSNTYSQISQISKLSQGASCPYTSQRTPYNHQVPFGGSNPKDDQISLRKHEYVATSNNSPLQEADNAPGRLSSVQLININLEQSDDHQLRLGLAQKQEGLEARKANYFK